MAKKSASKVKKAVTKPAPAKKVASAKEPVVKESSAETPEYVSAAQITKAIDELQKFIKRQEENKEDGKSDLFADEDSSQKDLYLQFNFKKIYTSRAEFKPKSIALPNPIYNLETFRTCLILRDNFITEEILNAIHEAKIPTLAKVLPFNDIKTVYEPYEKREELVEEYDFFVVDDALFSSLPSAMGKIFYTSEKFPRTVRVAGFGGDKSFSLQGLQALVQRAVSSASFLPPFSKETTIKVAAFRDNVSNKDIVANVQAVLKYFDPSTLTTAGLKLQDSPVLPLFYTDRIYNDEDVLENVPETAAEEPSEDIYAKALLELTDEQTVSTLIGTRRVKRTTKDEGKVVKP